MDATDFWIQLEYRVGLEIEGLRGDEFRGMWCDGFDPHGFAIIGGRPTVMGRVWLARGRREQQRWRFSLLLAEHVRSEADIDWAASLPPHYVTGWLSLDSSRRIMTVDPAAAYPDLESGKE